MCMKKKILLGASIAAAVLVRYYVFFYMMNTNNPNGLMVSDPLGYLDEAQNIVNGGEWFMGYLNGNYQLLTMHPKGFSVLLAILIKLFGDTGYLTALHWLMLIADVSVCIFLFQIIKKLFHSEGAGVLASWLWALNPHAIFNCAQDEPDAFACFFIAVLIYFYFKEYKKTWTRYLVLGVWCGFAHYFRSEFLLLVPVIWFADVLRTRKILSVTKWWLVCICAFLCVNSPWMIYSYQKSGHVMMSSQNAWGAAWGALGENPDNSYGLQIGDQYVWDEAVENGFDGAWTYDANQYFKERWITYVTENPGEYAETIIKYRLAKAFFPGEYVWFNLNITYNNEAWLQSCSWNGYAKYVTPCYMYTTFILWYEYKLASYFSVVEFAFLIVFAVLTFKKKRFLDYNLLFWIYLYFPVVISLLKQIEPRNIAGNQPVLIIAMTMVIYWAFHWIKGLIKHEKAVQQ